MNFQIIFRIESNTGWRKIQISDLDSSIEYVNGSLIFFFAVFYTSNALNAFNDFVCHRHQLQTFDFHLCCTNIDFKIVGIRFSLLFVVIRRWHAGNYLSLCI